MQKAKSYIIKELETLYPPEEIESFFFLIIEHMLEYDRTTLLMKMDEELNVEEQGKYQMIVERLKKHEPIQYILGETEFYGLKFLCKKNVLIPRPETEELVDWILRDINGHPTSSGVTIKMLDIGTGTGCIPISLKKNLPHAEVFACDISEKCLDLAEWNALRHEVDIDVFELNILNPDLEEDLPILDIIVSNPPYVTENEKQLMQKNVLDFEPELALFVDDNEPLIFYLAIVEFSKNHLKKGGAFTGKLTKLLVKNVFLCCRIRVIVMWFCEKTSTGNNEWFQQ